jgi:Flp pilus assembly protein TadD
MKNAILISSLVLAVTLGCGCASSHKSKAEAQSSQDTFAAGAGRAPSSHTSFRFAKILIAQGRDRDAIYVLSKIIRQDSKFLPAYNEIANVYVRSDRLDDAVAVLRAALQQAPNDAVSNNNLGMCHFLLDEHAQALELFSRAVALAPSNPTYHANRASALAMLGREDEAKAEYLSVLGSLQTEENLLTLSLAREQLEARRAAKAEPASTQPVTDAESPVAAN